MGSSWHVVPFDVTQLVVDERANTAIGGFAGSSANIRFVVQRIDSSGVLVWNSPYIILDDSSIFNVQGSPAAINVDGGATFAWTKRRDSVIKAFTQRVRSNGTSVFSGGPIRVSALDSASNGTWGHSDQRT